MFNILDTHELIGDVPPPHARPLLDSMMHLALRGRIGAAPPPTAMPRRSPLRHAPRALRHVFAIATL